MRISAAAAALVAVSIALAGCSGSSTGGAASNPPPSTSSARPTSTGSVIGGGSGEPSVAQSTGGAATAGTSTQGPKVVYQKLHNFTIADATFVGSREWVLGSADCLDKRGICDAVEYSGDSGRTWRSAPAPKANIDIPDPKHACSGTCVAHIRFASSQVGYAYSSNNESSGSGGALFMTTDGGGSWRRLRGSADALEAGDGNVIRVTHATRGCPPGCTYVVQTAAIGSTHWHTVHLPAGLGGVVGDSISLARAGGGLAYLLLQQNPAGGASDAHSTLWESGDDGQHWVYRDEPCPDTDSHEVDATALTAGPDGSATVLCQQRAGTAPRFTATASTLRAPSFHAGSRSALGAGQVSALGAASSKVLFVSSDDTYRSTNAGRSFARLSANAGSSPGQLSWIGFASSTLGHAISLERRLLWTTTDGGVRWHSHSFG